MIELTLTQKQDDEAFLQPVTVEIGTKAGIKRVTITPKAKETSVSVRSAKPTKIVIDPDEAILKEVLN
jgi:hypothetical protein